tara:strand:+ start:652 stop:1098 length:447 start_codon:yes stop_codon:yes gene_type:complete
MTTGTIIIKRALQKIGASSAVSEPDPHSVQTALEALNSMIAMWTALGIAIDAVPLAAAGDDLSEKADTTNAVILNLAVLISPDFDNGNQIVSPALQMSAVVQYKYVTSLYQAFTIPKKVVSSTLPKGQGNRDWKYDSAFFVEGSGLGN